MTKNIHIHTDHEILYEKKKCSKSVLSDITNKANAKLNKSFYYRDDLLKHDSISQPSTSLDSTYKNEYLTTTTEISDISKFNNDFSETGNLLEKSTIYPLNYQLIRSKSHESISTVKRLHESFYTDRKSSYQSQKNYVSTVSLSQLDNIKRETINNLKNYRTKFQTLNLKFKTHIIDKYNSLSKRSKRIKKCERLIRKNGESNINRINIESRSRKYMADIFNTLIDMKWRYIFLVFIFGFIITWLIFGVLWFLMQKYEKDCIINLSTDNFISALLFSIETQQTIGYGSRYVNDQCEIATVFIMLQCCISILLHSFMGGIVFAKLSRPKKRTETLIFSKNAVLSSRDGVYCLMCRVGDMRKTHIVQAHVRMFLIKTRYTSEGECIPCHAIELEVGGNVKGTDRLLFMPIIVEHCINEQSPLWNLCNRKFVSINNNSNNRTNNDKMKEVPYEFKSNDFEIIVVLEGTVESTGATTQARTSYLPYEIQWNHIFKPLLDPNHHKPTIDYSKFNETMQLINQPELQTSPQNVTSSPQVDETKLCHDIANISVIESKNYMKKQSTEPSLRNPSASDKNEKKFFSSTNSIKAHRYKKHCDRKTLSNANINSVDLNLIGLHYSKNGVPNEIQMKII